MKERLKTTHSEKMKKGYQSFCEKGRETNDGYLSWFHKHDVTIYLVIIALPAAFASADFFERLGQIFMVYPNQMVHGYDRLTLNAGTFYALIFTNFKGEEYISIFALFLCVVTNGTLIFLLQRYKRPFGKKDIVKMFFLFAMTMPYFMPHMHERYFYLADILVILYVLINAKRF